MQGGPWVSVLWARLATRGSARARARACLREVACSQRLQDHARHVYVSGKNWAPIARRAFKAKETARMGTKA